MLQEREERATARASSSFGPDDAEASIDRLAGSVLPLELAMGTEPDRKFARTSDKRRVLTRTRRGGRGGRSGSAAESVPGSVCSATRWGRGGQAQSESARSEKLWRPFESRPTASVDARASQDERAARRRRAGARAAPRAEDAAISFSRQLSEKLTGCGLRRLAAGGQICYAPPLLFHVPARRFIASLT